MGVPTTKQHLENIHTKQLFLFFSTDLQHSLLLLQLRTRVLCIAIYRVLRVLHRIHTSTSTRVSHIYAVTIHVLGGIE